MNLEESNKKYVRDNVPDYQQCSFFDYFVTIDDHHLFHQWSTQRTVEVVQQFKDSLKEKDVASVENKIQISTQKDDTLSIGNTSSNRKSQIAVQKSMRSVSAGKKESAFNFLKDIQDNILKSPLKKISNTSENWNNIKDNIWLNFKISQGSEKKKKVFEKDPFEDFDSCILSPENKKIPKKQTSPKSNQSEREIEQPKTPPAIPSESMKVQLKRSQEIKLTVSTELKRPKNDIRNEIKQKKITLSDKLFKWKISQQIPCKKISTNFSITKASITGHEIVHRTLLPDYAIYIISVHPSKIVCKRSYDDFLQLRNILNKMYPGIKVPSLDSGSWFSQSDISLINKNKTSLEMFLNDLIEHPLLSKSQVLGQFLSNKDQKSIEKILQEYDDIPSKASLAQLFNEKGILKISLSQESNKVIQQLPKWKKIFQNYYQKYIDLVSTLTSQFQSIKQTYTHITKLSSNFITKINNLSELKTIINVESLQQLLEKQIKYFNSNRNQLEKDITLLKQKYNSVLKYEKLNVSSFEPMYQNIQSLTQKYIKRLENQPESPSSQLNHTNVNHHNTKFSSDIWHQSQNFKVFQYQLGYLHSQLLQETQIFNNKMIKNLHYIWSTIFPQNLQEKTQK